MKVYLVRHGQTNYNELGLCNADPKIDVQLSASGTKQVVALARTLAEIPFDHVYVSELPRTQQTAEIIFANRSVPRSVDARLNDNRTGFEGRPASDYYAALSSSTDKWNVRFSDGESMTDVNQRVREFIDDLKTQPYHTVLLVTSKIIVQSFCGIVRELSNEQAWELKVDNGSFVTLDI